MGAAGNDVMDKVNDLESRKQQLEQELASLSENGAAPGRMMLASPGLSAESGPELTQLDSDAQEERDRQADTIRRQLLELNQEAERLTADFT